MKLFAIVLSVALVASVSAQADMMQTYMMMRMLGGGSSSGSSGSSGASATALSGGAGRSGINPMFLAMGGDRMRDLMMCNYIPSRMMKQMCMARAMQ